MEIKSVNLDQPYSSLDIYHSHTDKALPGLVILPGGSYNQIMERDCNTCMANICCTISGG